MQRKSTNVQLLMQLLTSIPDGDACMVWPGKKMGGWVDGGYGRCSFNGKVTLVHRKAYEMAVGPIPEGICVLHRCDNRPCFRPSHLFLGTYADNVHDCNAKGRRNNPMGIRHGRAKLTLEQVEEIRRLRVEGSSVKNWLTGLESTCAILRDSSRGSLGNIRLDIIESFIIFPLAVPLPLLRPYAIPPKVRLY